MRRNTRVQATLRASFMVVGAVLVTLGMVSVAGAATPCEPVSAELEYVSMGDSYSSGYGLSDASGDCNRSAAKSFPKLLQSMYQFGTYKEVACSGATTHNFANNQGSNPPQYDALSDTTDVITYSIGGNDLGFTSILTNCAASLDCRNDYGGSTMPDLLARVHGDVGDKMEAAMREVTSRAPNADIFIIGYPDILAAGPGSPAWEVSCLPTSTVISSSERTALRNLQRTLNEEIAARAATVGGRVHYIDIYTDSIGHDVCSSSAWVSALSTLYHPTDRGHREIANRLAVAVSANWDAQCQALTTTTTTTTSTVADTTTTTMPASTTSTSLVYATTTAPPPPPTVAPPPATVAPAGVAGVDGVAGAQGVRGTPGAVGASGTAGAAGASASSLPKTGSDSTPLVVLGVAMILLGLCMTLPRRLFDGIRP